MKNAIHSTAQRLRALDALRGLLMVLMAIDHASYFLAKNHPSEVWGLPLPSYSNGWLFITRFITHICPTGFFFVMGMSMVLFTRSRQDKGWSWGKIRRHFVLRGLVIILAQQTFENFAWLFGTPETATDLVRVPGGGDTVWLNFGVLTALGLTMMLCSLCLKTSNGIILGISASAILATQLFTPSPAKVAVRYAPLLRLLLIPGQSGMWQVYYPIIPWLGAAGLGLVFGRSLVDDAGSTARKAVVAGLGSLVGFVMVRLIGGWGNLHPVGAGWIGFFNVTKYPPSLAYMLLTMSGVLLLLALLLRFEAHLGLWSTPLVTIGRTPLFFYLLHLYLFMLIGKFFPQGASLPVLYALWLAGLALLYPVCRWYDRLKHRADAKSLWHYI